jgi:DNA-directed RNA polymerase subunit E'/Rpb7
MDAHQIGNTFNVVELTSKVRLKPHQMSYEYEEHIKHNLEHKVVGRCNNDGMITSVIKLTDCSENMVVREDFSACSEFDVTYIAKICVPVIDTVSVLNVESIIYDFNDFLVRASNGYVTCVLAVGDNNRTTKVVNGEVFVNDRTEPLKAGDYIKVFIKNRRIEAGDKSVGIIGNLLDVATKDEINLYYQGNLAQDEVERVDTIVHFNEDDDYADV